MRVLATSIHGTNDLVAAEAEALGLHVSQLRGDGVVLECEPEDAARAMVRMRLPSRLLLLLTEVRARDADELYNELVRLHWPDWMEPRHTFAVHCTGPLPEGPNAGHGPPIKNHVFAAQRAKDAIVDRLRKRYGERPNVDLDDPDIRVVIRFRGGDAEIALDLCGEPLHRRGYRVAEAEAPLKENLAAAMAITSGWRADRPLLDPMCGSGTLLIEAVASALQLAPGRARDFAVERWPWHGAALGKLLDAEREAANAEAEATISGATGLDILGIDHDRGAVKTAQIQVERAGLASIIRIERGDARRMDPPPQGTLVLSNPPYGKRIGGRETEALYQELGETFAGWQAVEAWLVDGHEGFEQAFGLPSLGARSLMNGAIPIALRHYRLGEGAAAG